MTSPGAPLETVPPRAEVVVVGAGLAGLTATRHLLRAGRDVHLFDPNAEPGGRVRTEIVDGHRCDLGFQVLLTGYPAVVEELDLPNMVLHPLCPGCVVVRDGIRHVLPDPFRTPGRWLQALRYPLAGPIDKLKTRSLRERLKRTDVEQIFREPERMAADALRDFGFSERFLSTFWIPFFSAVFLDPPLEVTTRMFNFVFRSIALGDIVLPAGGMGMVPRSIAASIPGSAYHPRTRVTGLSIEQGKIRGVVVTEAENPTAAPRTVLAETVVLAVDPGQAARLLPFGLPALEPLGVSVVYFSAPRPVTQEKMIFLNGGGSSPGHHVVFLSNICPDYAPPGAQLVSVTVLGTPESPGDVLAERVRRQMQVWFPDGGTEHWRWLTTYKIPMAQFRQPPGLLGRLPGPRTAIEGLFLAGDYTRNSSVQGALESGQRAARAVLSPA
jgi:phytoene dehydrogenase-like protein